MAAALARGIPLPHSCRAGRCASCKARLLSGQVAYPEEKLPAGIAAGEAARGEVLLCQAQARSDLAIQARMPAAAATLVAHGVIAGNVVALPTGGVRVTLRILGAPLAARPGQFVEVEDSTGTRERAPVVAAGPDIIEVELTEPAAQELVRVRGPYDTPR